MNDSIINALVNSEASQELVHAATAYIYAEIIFGIIGLIAFCVIGYKIFND